MPAITSSGSATAGRMQLQAARREAREAEQSARSLQQQAQSAQRSADQQQARADGLSARAADASGYSDTTRRNLASLESSVQRASAALGEGRRAGLLVDTYA